MSVDLCPLESRFRITSANFFPFSARSRFLIGIHRCDEDLSSNMFSQRYNADIKGIDILVKDNEPLAIAFRVAKTNQYPTASFAQTRVLLQDR